MSQGGQPWVTAVITTCNRADLLQRALASVLAQDYPQLEIIVVDDASSDSTPEVLAAAERQHGIKVIRQAKSQGACAARNAGIEAAATELVAGLDDDDIWHPQRISRMVAAWDPKWSLIAASDLLLEESGRSRMHQRGGEVDAARMLLHNAIGNQVLVPRERVLAIGGFDTSLVAAQDYDMWLRLIQAYGPALTLPDTLQTVHMGHAAGQISSSLRRRRSGYRRFYLKHRDSMTRDQRKAHLYQLYRQGGKRLSLSMLARLWTPESGGEALRYYLRSNAAPAADLFDRARGALLQRRLKL